MLLALVLVLSIIACFLPWLKMDADITGKEPIERDIYGYDYIVPLGVPYTAPVAILNVIGFILSAYSFKWIQRTKMLNVVAGILILVGAMASFGYTTSVAFADVSNKGGSFHAWGEYGMGLEALLGFLMIIIGAKQKPKASVIGERAYKVTEEGKMKMCDSCGQKQATRKPETLDGMDLWLCEDCYNRWHA